MRKKMLLYGKIIYKMKNKSNNKKLLLFLELYIYNILQYIKYIKNKLQNLNLIILELMNNSNFLVLLMYFVKKI